MREVVDALGEAPDFLVVATSTCGTVRGCGEFIADHGLHTWIGAGDSVGSRIFDDRRAERHIPGLGAGIHPPHLDADMVWEAVLLTDAECVRGCRRLLDREAILAGGSSGAVVGAVERIRDRIPEGSICVLILPDRGERYLDTVYSQAWVARITGSVEGDEDESARQEAGLSLDVAS
jgi:cysteine synthase A